MEGLIFILFFAFVAFAIFGSANKSSNSASSKGLKSSGDYDIPDALQARWDAESRRRNKSNMTPTQRGRARLAARGLQTIQGSKQSRRAKERDLDQTKEFAQSGTGAPRDRNGNRRDDWGRKGNMGAGFFGPLLGSLIVAGALAALFSQS